MQVDFVFASLLIVLGAMVAYALDEKFEFTPRFSVWIEKLLGGH
jgi:hypothetical protein